jgi:hypothetical protein
MTKYKVVVVDESNGISHSLILPSKDTDVSTCGIDDV